MLFKAEPMWRNGRRNGLKIRWALKGPCRFESGHRYPVKTHFTREIRGNCRSVDCACSRIRAHGLPVYLAVVPSPSDCKKSCDVCKPSCNPVQDWRATWGSVLKV